MNGQPLDYDGLLKENEALRIRLAELEKESREGERLRQALETL